MNNNNYLMTKNEQVQISSKVRLPTTTAADQPAIDELCHILAHILRRISVPTSMNPSKE